jgi:type II secretory pathway predicted ATPase ExeA
LQDAKVEHEKTLLQRQIVATDAAIDALVYEQLGLYEIGLSNETMYIEDPNVEVVQRLAEFLSVDGSGVFLVYGEPGMGKSALKEFALRMFASDPRFAQFSVDNVGPLTPYQVAQAIYRGVRSDSHAETDVPRTMGEVLERIERRLMETRALGVMTVIWVDEAQKVSVEKIELIRSIADLKTPEGDLVCKVVFVGTTLLRDKLAVWITTHPEEARAFDDRSAFYSVQLHPWSETDIQAWWRRLAQYTTGGDMAAPTHPFSAEVARVVFEIAEGKPRSIVQLTRSLLTEKAVHWVAHPTTPIELSREDAITILAARVASAQIRTIEPKPTRLVSLTTKKKVRAS